MTATKTVTVPLDVWGRLATAADVQGCTVEDILVNAINHVLRPQDRKDQIILLVRCGYTDRVIAERTGEQLSFIGDVRRSAGLPPNRQRRR